MALKQNCQGCRRVLLELLHFLKRWRFFYRATDEVAQGNEHYRGKKWDTPAPGEELLSAQDGGEHQHEDGGQCHAHGYADLWEGPEESATTVRSVLDGQQRRTAPLAAGGHTLQDAQKHQQDWSG